jgi:hypothetical protein
MKIFVIHSFVTPKKQCCIKNKKIRNGTPCLYAPKIIDEIIRLYEIEKGKE